jgi:hypothetical protein
MSHNILCFIFFIAILAIVIIRLTVLQFILKMFCKRFLEARVESLETSQNLNSTLTLQEIEQIFKLKKMQLNKLNKMQIEAPNLTNFLEKSIEYDKDAMLEKMNKLKVKDLKSVKDDFDRKYEEVIKSAPNEEKVLKGDISYNLGVKVD